ncbi:NAD(P)-binding protein [Gymnopus androsaceus JB14]|uniref:NAD(P)-binding protein n=1 Tax=Gymnopus androsaceus JB14 TaxID=1447944 RepID=A0A6A4HIV3_9AGAR|nr:NAD(P)-binding protein [Gymnopus androsaceus JB14]
MPSSTPSPQGKIVLVTGGSSGIGKMIASGFAQNGSKVYIASRKEAVAEISAELKNKNAGGSVEYIVANVGSKSGCNALIAEFKKREPNLKLHVLVNNSGITWGGPYDDFPEEKGWDNVFNVNVKSIFYSELTPLLCKDSHNGDPARVINISSTASVDPQSEGALSRPGNGTWSYQGSKAAVNHLTSQLALKLAPSHVTVNAILPGCCLPSRMTAFGLQTAGEEAFIAHQPTGRFGSPSDMAGMALFLASPASAHVTGALILLDGGARIKLQ